MVLKSIHIKNYRCVREETLYCSPLTVLVGPNGAGKSTFLQALQLFYNSRPELDEEDLCHDRNGDAVEITVTYANLSSAAATQFAKYVQNGELAVTRVLRLEGAKVLSSFHGSCLSHPEFASVRAAGGAKEVVAAYKELRQKPEFVELAQATTKVGCLAALDEWEETHPASCVRHRDDGQFFGFEGVGAGYLDQYTKFILVPAVRDAADDGADGKNSPLGQLIDLAVRNALVSDSDIQALNAEVTSRYRGIIDKAKQQELQRLQDDLTTALGAFVPSVDVSLSWDEISGVQLPMPRAIAKIGEQGYRSDIERKGHGLQRAFIMTMLQYLERRRTSHGTTAREAGTEGVQLPNVIIGIEEPELYQHPDRQRHIARVLRQLAAVSSVPEVPSTQVIYTTHSPHFVGLDRFDDIRLVRKAAGDPAAVPTTTICSTTLTDVAAELAMASSATAGRYTAETLRARLNPLMTPWMNEGFFADAVVLVEGDQDRAAVLATATTLGYELERLGFAVIPCLSKTNVDRPALIFRSLGIPTYLIWDSDESKREPGPNRRLLRLLGVAEEDYPEAVAATYACFREKLETTLRAELIPSVMDVIVAELQQEFEMRRGDLLKNPVMMAELLKRARQQGTESATLEAIVKAIVALRPTVAPPLPSAFARTG